MEKIKKKVAEIKKKECGRTDGHTLFAYSTDSNSWLFSAHNKVRMMMCHSQEIVLQKEKWIRMKTKRNEWGNE
jgi:hypothetical protein